MKKTFMAAFAAAVSLLVAGCATQLSSPRVAGNFAGRAAYVAYSHVAGRQSEETREKVEKIWAQVNEVNEVSDLKVARTLLGERFDEVIADADLTPEERLVLSSIRDEMLARIDEVIDAKLASNQDGVQFLIGVRDGVNAMIEMTSVKEE